MYWLIISVSWCYWLVVSSMKVNASNIFTQPVLEYMWIADMAKNKGFLLSGPTEISIQRKQLKEVIDSLLPACIEPDLDSGAPFKAEAIIANPPAYGGLNLSESI